SPIRSATATAADPAPPRVRTARRPRAARPTAAGAASAATPPAGLRPRPGAGTVTGHQEPVPLPSRRLSATSFPSRRPGPHPPLAGGRGARNSLAPVRTARRASSRPAACRAARAHAGLRPAIHAVPSSVSQRTLDLRRSWHDNCEIPALPGYRFRDELDTPLPAPVRASGAASAPPPCQRQTLLPAPVPTDAKRRFYVPLRVKFVLVLAASLAWMGLSVFLSTRWLDDLSAIVGVWPAVFVIAFVAWVPGFMNAFLIGSILVDRRPPRRHVDRLPDVCVLVACYNEAANVRDTLASLARQDYMGNVEVVVIDDGSTDGTLALARECARKLSRPGLAIRVLAQPRNGGKARALNRGLAETTQELVVTVDGDSYLRPDALRKIVQRYLSDPPGTVAVAGAVLVRNSRENWLARCQEWDYFHGIAAVKRVQSMYHGTLVAQGAFSLYTRDALVQAGGWPECVGEDIVLSWALLETGARIGYCEDACLFT